METNHRMITKCLFCSYNKSTPLSKPILNILLDKNTPEEDYNLWLKRMLKNHGYRDYLSVKIHMGMKHKKEVYKYIAPDIELEDWEKELFLNSVKI